VTGDNANALEFMDWDEDNEDELVVGSDDFSIRVFKSEGNTLTYKYIYRVDI
jgi:hypothetical protein